MKIVKEFKEFIMRGNVMDLAVGVIIGGAFGAIVTSLTDDIISPILGIFGGMDFSNWSDAYVEFIIGHFSDATIPEEVYDYWDTYQSKIAEALIDEIGEYATNSYIESYVEKLNNYVLVEV